MFLCDICGKSYALKNGLQKHLNKKHSPTRKEVCLTNRFPCDICGKSYALKNVLQRHINKKHPDYPPTTKEVSKEVYPNKCSFPECEYPFISYADLIQHMNKHHSIVCKMENHVFMSKKDYDTWKRNVETTTFCEYVVRQGKKRSSDGSLRQKFVCHRSFNHKPKGTGQRTVKPLGSNKINKVCPAHINLEIKKNGLFYVTFYSTHVGHGQGIEEMRRTRLPKDTRAEIAKKLTEGVSCKRILSDFRKNDPVTRVECLSSQDLLNIKRDFNINKSYMRDKIDCVLTYFKDDEIFDAPLPQILDNYPPEEAVAEIISKEKVSESPLYKEILSKLETAQSLLLTNNYVDTNLPTIKKHLDIVLEKLSNTNFEQKKQK